MNADIQIIALEEQNGNVLGFQVRSAVTHVHPHSAEQVIAMCFDYQPAIRAGDPAEQAAQSRLGAGVEMHFRLLQ